MRRQYRNYWTGSAGKANSETSSATSAGSKIKKRGRLPDKEFWDNMENLSDALDDFAENLDDVSKHGDDTEDIDDIDDVVDAAEHAENNALSWEAAGAGIVATGGVGVSAVSSKKAGSSEGKKKGK